MEPPSNFAAKLKGYIERVEAADKEATRADRFRDFIREVFPSTDVGALNGFYPELEHYMKMARPGYVVKGRADSLFGNLIIEFEPELDKAHIDESSEQLRRYTAIIWGMFGERGQRHQRLTCIATDGILFYVYKPRRLTTNLVEVRPEDVALDELDFADIKKSDPEQVFAWLHRYVILAATELRPVDPDEFARVFGVGSSTFQDSFKSLRAAWNQARPDSAVLYEQWASHLRIVYGSKVDSESLYLKHTYLASLAKLLVYVSYSGGALPGSEEELLRILDGTVFRQWRIVNFIESDFFSWLGRSIEGVRFAQRLASKLAPYDLSTITSDVFKGLYQGLVDPEARHDLGEYYTPDWLAQMLVQELLQDDPNATILDPSCGSGTFLAAAIASKRQVLKEPTPQVLLDRITSGVVGMDVHPLAVIISRATYILLLGRDLLESRTGEIAVPVYLADSIRLPEESSVMKGSAEVYSVKADKKELYMPKEVAKDPRLADAIIDLMSEYSKSIARGQRTDLDDFQLYLESALRFPEKSSKDWSKSFYESAEAMASLIKAKRDTIWGFILKNYYKPVSLSERKFDCIAGNPPWLSYRYVKSIDYQRFLKDLIVEKYHLLDSDKVELMTQLELASLFFVRCAELYLRDGGKIGFVLPRSLFVADQHGNFRSGKYEGPSLGFKRIFDLEDVEPLFNVPSCVFIATKGAQTEYPVSATIIRGKLPRRNASLSESLASLSMIQSKVELQSIGQRSFLAEGGKGTMVVAKGRSEYYANFRAGACTYPRSFWSVEVSRHPKLGSSKLKPFVKTSSRAEDLAKGEYRALHLSGEIESQFLWATLSGSELVPFGNMESMINVLPVEVASGKYRVITKAEASKRHFDGLYDWLAIVEDLWRKRRGEKSSRVTVYDWLDWQGKLTSQSPGMKYKVLYNVSGTYLVSTVIKNGPIQTVQEGMRLEVNGLIADWKTIWYETNDSQEAYYLCGILNSPLVDELIKPMQSRGAFGARDIVKKPLELPIPHFNAKNSTHIHLAELATQCSKETEKILPALVSRYNSVGVIRREVKKALTEELKSVNELATKVLEGGVAYSPGRKKATSDSDLTRWIE